MLNSEDLQSAISKIQFSHSVDLFTSRLNTQYKQYISYRKDPYAMHVDAFNIPWTDIDFHCFPPLSCILRVIKTVIHEQARGISALPDWPTQLSYPRLNTFLEHPPVVPKPVPRFLMMPSQQQLQHPLTKTLALAICLVSGKNYK